MNGQILMSCSEGHGEGFGLFLSGIGDNMSKVSSIEYGENFELHGLNGVLARNGSILISEIDLDNIPKKIIPRKHLAWESKSWDCESFSYAVLSLSSRVNLVSTFGGASVAVVDFRDSEKHGASDWIETRDPQPKVSLDAGVKAACSAFFKDEDTGTLFRVQNGVMTSTQMRLPWTKLDVYRPWPMQSFHEAMPIVVISNRCSENRSLTYLFDVRREQLVANFISKMFGPLQPLYVAGMPQLVGGNRAGRPGILL